MKLAICRIVGISPYSQSRPVTSKKTRDETHDDFEQRTWRERCHTDGKGIVYVPPMSLKNCLAEAAKYKSIQIPGKGKSTYTKHFEAGIMVIDPCPLNVHVDNVEGERLFVPASGKRGDGKRVWKTFPVFREWAIDARFFVLDETIDEDVFTLHLTDAGQFIGIGRFRPRNNGFYGRFRVDGIEWQDVK